MTTRIMMIVAISILTAAGVISCKSKSEENSTNQTVEVTDTNVTAVIE